MASLGATLHSSTAAAEDMMTMPQPTVSMKAAAGVMGTQRVVGVSMNKTPTMMIVAAAVVAAGDKHTTRATTPLLRQPRVMAANRVMGAVAARAGGQNTLKAAAVVQGSMVVMVGSKAASETAAAGLLGGRDTAQALAGRDLAAIQAAAVVRAGMAAAREGMAAAAGRPAESSLARMLEASQHSTARHMKVSAPTRCIRRPLITTCDASLCMLALALCFLCPRLRRLQPFALFLSPPTCPVAAGCMHVAVHLPTNALNQVPC